MKNLKLLIGVFTGSAAFLFAASPAQAQSYPCPAGPGPGEVQVGTSGGSHGIASTPVCASNGTGGYGGSTGGSSTPPAYNPLAEAMSEQIWAELQIEERKLALEKDPRFQQFKRGSWRYFQGTPASRAGENCTAMWTREGGVVSITGPGPNFNAGMLTFWSPDIPRPPKTEMVTVMLNQSKYSAQTVKALNFSIPGIDFGAIALTVPTIDAALNTMLDVENFTLSMDDKQVAAASWTAGLDARDKLKACVAKRKPA